MPRKRVYRKRNPKRRSIVRRVARRRMGYRRRGVVSRGVPRYAFPSNRIVKMRYVENFLLNPTNSGAADALYVFRANSIFDPNYTGTGHQPIGHDEWSNFYSQYTVIGSKIRARCRRASGAANAIMGITTSYVPGLLTTAVTTLMENGLSKYSYLSGSGNAPYDTKGLLISQGWSAKKFFNLQSVKDNQYWVGAKFGTNPVSDGDAYFQVWAAAAIGGGSASDNIEVSVTIDYTVLVSEPRVLGQS